jgi:hypothetical protein
MSERLLRPAEIEELLFALGPELDWPATPDFTPRRRGARPGRRYLLAALAAAAALTAALTASAASDFVFHGVRIVPVQVLPSVPPAASPIVAPKREPNLAAASRDAGFRVEAPAALGTPQTITETPGPRTLVTLDYGTAIVTEASGSSTDFLFATKFISSGTTTVTRTKVGSSDAIWIEGSPHEVYFAGQMDTLRLATNTLIWERDGVVYRLEDNVTLTEAQRIAATVPPPGG